MKNSSKNFYIKKFFIPTAENMDLSDIPMLVRRKMSSLDKIAYSAVKEVYEDGVQEVVFSSQYGEIDRLKSIIESYLACNEASPAKFSASVHNYFVGFLCQLKGLTISYNSLSAGENTLSIGLVKSIISKKSKVLYCFAESVPEMNGCACVICDKEDADSIECTFTQGSFDVEGNELEMFKKFLLGEVSSFKTPCGLIERVEK